MAQKFSWTIIIFVAAIILVIVLWCQSNTKSETFTSPISSQSHPTLQSHTELHSNQNEYSDNIDLVDDINIGETHVIDNDILIDETTSDLLPIGDVNDNRNDYINEDESDNKLLTGNIKPIGGMNKKHYNSIGNGKMIGSKNSSYGTIDISKGSGLYG